MAEIFGNKDALIGSLELGIGAAFVLGAFIFRKSVANDMLDKGFSIIGSCGLGIITFIVINSIFDVLKMSVGIGFVAWLLGGFLLADFIQDGYSDGGGD